MAPLKLDHRPGLVAPEVLLPCLKRHGSIEAFWIRDVITVPLHLPCLKRHGSIEASAAIQPLARRRRSLPCLKRHGSIEAPSSGGGTRAQDILPCLKGAAPLVPVVRTRWFGASHLSERHGSVNDDDRSLPGRYLAPCLKRLAPLSM